MGLKYWGSACQAEDFLLEQNITKHSIIWLIPRPRTVLMKVCAGMFLFCRPSIFQRRVIRAGALRPELADSAIDWSNLVVQSWRRGRVLLFLPNEREAKLAASFDPEGIKIVLLMEVERSGLNVSLSVWCTAGKDIQRCSEESEAGLVHGTGGPIHHVLN